MAIDEGLYYAQYGIDYEKCKTIEFNKSNIPYWEELPISDVLDKIRAEIEQAAVRQFQIAMGISDLNERYAHIRMENAYRHSLNTIDKYKVESED